SEARLILDDRSCRLFITHLSLDKPIRAPQIQHIVEHIGEQDVPTILAGDFNVKEDAELALIDETIVTKAASAATFPSWKPTKALAHLSFSHHFALSRVYAFDRYTFSDHLPLVVELDLVPRRS